MLLTETVVDSEAVVDGDSAEVEEKALEIEAEGLKLALALGDIESDADGDETRLALAKGLCDDVSEPDTEGRTEWDTVPLIETDTESEFVDDVVNEIPKDGVEKTEADTAELGEVRVVNVEETLELIVTDATTVDETEPSTDALASDVIETKGDRDVELLAETRVLADVELLTIGVKDGEDVALGEELYEDALETELVCVRDAAPENVTLLEKETAAEREKVENPDGELEGLPETLDEAEYEDDAEPLFHDADAEIVNHDAVGDTEEQADGEGGPLIVTDVVGDLLCPPTIEGVGLADEDDCSEYEGATDGDDDTDLVKLDDRVSDDFPEDDTVTLLVLETLVEAEIDDFPVNVIDCRGDADKDPLAVEDGDALGDVDTDDVTLGSDERDVVTVVVLETLLERVTVTDIEFEGVRVLSNDSVVDIELDAVRDEHPDTVL